MLFPFDLTNPVSSLISLVVETVIIVMAISLANVIITHGINIKRIFVMALLAYLLTPIVGYFLVSFLPAIPYLLPLIVWIVLGELILKDIDFKKKAIVAAIGYVIFIILGFIGLSGIIHSLVGF